MSVPIWAPRVEPGAWLRRINFFPPPPDFSRIDSICIGTKNRTIGDALMLSTLPKKLKALYPRLKILTYPRAFNPVVFRNNPHIDGCSYFPGALYGDDCNTGHGHLIQLKEQFFGLPISNPPKPEIYLSDTESRKMKQFVAKHSFSNRPLVVIHPWGHTEKSVGARDFWIRLVKENHHRVRFWQLGIERHPPIPGCDYYFFTSKRFEEARRLFALTSQARAFIGVDSGPMHVARAFGVASLVLTNRGKIQDYFVSRRQQPYFLGSNQLIGFLYEENEHLELDRLSADDSLRTASRFIEKLGS